jgi:hypothetical protein
MCSFIETYNMHAVKFISQIVTFLIDAIRPIAIFVKINPVPVFWAILAILAWSVISSNHLQELFEKKYGKRPIDFVFAKKNDQDRARTVLSLLGAIVSVYGLYQCGHELTKTKQQVDADLAQTQSRVDALELANKDEVAWVKRNRPTP